MMVGVGVHIVIKKLPVGFKQGAEENRFFIVNGL